MNSAKYTKYSKKIKMLNMTKEREHRFPSRPFILQIALNELVYEQGENNSTSALHV